MEPPGSCLVAASPFEPASGVAWWPGMPEGGGEEPLDLADGEGDQPGVGGRPVVWPGWRRCRGAGAASELGGGDRADRQGGHDQHGMAQDRGVEPRLALVQPEAVLAELEALLRWPAQSRCPDQPRLGRELAV